MHNLLFVHEGFANTLASLLGEATTNTTLLEILAAKSSEPQASTALTYTVDNGIAKLAINGMLYDKVRPFSIWLNQLFGEPLPVAYDAIAVVMQAMQADASVESIELHIDSPGGIAGQMDNAIGAIRNTAKPTTAVVAGYCCSAAYWLASCCDQIIATDRNAMFGSIGVYVSFGEFKNENFVIHRIRSQHAPKKNLDPTQAEGQQAIQEAIDLTEAMFLEDVAVGRKVSVEEVIAKYGQGATMLAAQAAEVGMIDALHRHDGVAKENQNREENIPWQANATQEEKKMTDEEMAAKIAAAQKEAVAADRSRCAALDALASYGKPCAEVDKLITSAKADGRTVDQIIVEAKELQAAAATRTAEGNGANVDQPPATDTTPPTDTRAANVAATATLQEQEAMMMESLDMEDNK